MLSVCQASEQEESTGVDEQNIKSVLLLENMYFLKLTEVFTCFSRAAYSLGKHIFSRVVEKVRNRRCKVQAVLLH